jgi:hypothetical protein
MKAAVMYETLTSIKFKKWDFLVISGVDRNKFVINCSKIYNQRKMYFIYADAIVHLRFIFEKNA